MKEAGTTSPPRGHERIAFSRVVDLFASTLGREKSEELVISAARGLGYSHEHLTLSQTEELLTMLGSQPGIVGVAARFARSRIQAARGASSGRLARVVAPAPAVPAGPAPEAKPSPMSVTPKEIAALLEHTLGSEKSVEVVASAMQSLGVPDGRLMREQAVAVLEVIAKVQGIVGVVGRFAKARLILKFDAQT